MNLIETDKNLNIQESGINKQSIISDEKFRNLKLKNTSVFIFLNNF